jgi:magnesium transporter
MCGQTGREKEGQRMRGICYQIKDVLVETTLQKCLEEMGEVPYAIVLSPSTWMKYRDSFDMGFDMDPNPANIYNTKAEVNYDSITGTFSIPDRDDLNGEDAVFSFAMDEKGVVFIDRSGTAERLIKKIARYRKWRFPSLERFLYDFLETIIADDRILLNTYEKELNRIEEEILQGYEELSTARTNEIRGDLLVLRGHYEQLLDVSQVFEDNENRFFREDNIRFFRLFSGRMERRLAMVSSLRDYTVQVRDLYQTRLDVKQNRIMTILTIVTTVFMPLTLIVGWYGMNFRYMPELESPYAYPIVIIVSLAIVILSLWFFHKKKWL